MYRCAYASIADTNGRRNKNKEEPKMEEGRNFPEMIKDYRKKHLLSLDKMAKKANLTKATLYRIEHGKNAPNQLTRWKLEKLLNEDN